MRKTAAFGVVACLFVGLSWQGTDAQVPTGFNDVLKNVENGKKFHPIWPPLVGQSPIGILVRANNPKHIIGTFESIEHPQYKNPAFEFARGETLYLLPELEQKKEGGVKVDVSEIVGLFKPANAGGAGGGSAASSESGGSAASKGQPLTGVDLSSISEVRRTGGTFGIEWYSLGTLTGVATGQAVTAPTRTLLIDNDNRLWFMSRVLRFDGLTYELKAKNKFGAGFASGLMKWIPGISVTKATDTHVTLKVTAPVYLGYKLWRPGTDVGGAASPAFGFDGLPMVPDELGFEEIANLK